MWKLEVPGLGTLAIMEGSFTKLSSAPDPEQGQAARVVPAKGVRGEKKVGDGFFRLRVRAAPA